MSENSKNAKAEKEARKKSFRLIKTETPKVPKAATKKRKVTRFPFIPDLPPAA